MSMPSGQRLVHYNPFRSVNKYLQQYLEQYLQKQVIFATPQRAYAHIVDAINDKTKKFSNWPVFSVTMTDKRIDKEQLSPVLYKMDGGIGGSRIQDGTDIIYIQWIPMTFSYQLDIWADTRNRLESYINILTMILVNYPAFKIYYQESNKAWSVGAINFESLSDTSNLDPGEDLVEFRHTATFNIMTQIPVKATQFGGIEEAIANILIADDEIDMDSTEDIIITWTIKE